MSSSTLGPLRGDKKVSVVCNSLIKLTSSDDKSEIHEAAACTRLSDEEQWFCLYMTQFPHSGFLVIACIT